MVFLFIDLLPYLAKLSIKMGVSLAITAVVSFLLIELHMLVALYQTKYTIVYIWFKMIFINALLRQVICTKHKMTKNKK